MSPADWLLSLALTAALLWASAMRWRIASYEAEIAYQRGLIRETIVHLKGNSELASVELRQFLEEALE